MREMQRDRIDVAIHRQLARLAGLLRAVDLSGGTGTWAHLWSHGHYRATINSATRQGYLRRHLKYGWTLTAAGRHYLRDLDEAALTRR